MTTTCGSPRCDTSTPRRRWNDRRFRRRHNATYHGTAQAEAWQDRSIPPIEQIRPHVWSIPVDFSSAPIRYTFAYLITNDAGEAVVVDPGGESELGRDQLHEGIAAAGISVDKIVGVLVTHRHPDHLGLAVPG